jgi:two-component system, chemotaxis family, protein-glutamate methylesterase/glutaminase
MSQGPAPLIVIGASAGAVQALSAILPRLRPEFGCAVLVVVHVPLDGSGLVPLFEAKCPLKVREPDDKEPIVAGTIYFAPSDYHLLVEADHTISLTMDEPVLFSRPSIDVLFESAAEVHGPTLTAVVLTGANEDGANGAAAVAKAGGTVLVEDPQAAFVPTMPAAAIARCPQARILSLDAIADHLAKIGTR